MDFNQVLLMLFTWQNMLVMLGCGVVMELFKRGPTKEFAKSKWGKIGAYYAPSVWCMLFLMLPLGLGDDTMPMGSKFLLSLLLAALVSKVYNVFTGTIKHMTSK